MVKDLEFPAVDSVDFYNAKDSDLYFCVLVFCVYYSKKPFQPINSGYFYHFQGALCPCRYLFDQRPSRVTF